MEKIQYNNEEGLSGERVAANVDENRNVTIGGPIPPKVGLPIAAPGSGGQLEGGIMIDGVRIVDAQVIMLVSKLKNQIDNQNGQYLAKHNELANVLAQVEGLEQTNADLLKDNQDWQAKFTEEAKQRKYAQDARDTYSKREDEAKAEVEQVNSLIDLLDGAPPRKKDRPDGYGEVTLSPMTRLAAYFAARK